MAIKIKLEKDGFIKDGFVGYSFTTFFFNILVPAFRLDFNAFIVFLGISFSIIFNDKYDKEFKLWWRD